MLLNKDDKQQHHEHKAEWHAKKANAFDTDSDYDYDPSHSTFRPPATNGTSAHPVKSSIWNSIGETERETTLQNEHKQKRRIGRRLVGIARNRKRGTHSSRSDPSSRVLHRVFSLFLGTAEARMNLFPFSSRPPLRFGCAFIDHFKCTAPAGVWRLSLRSGFQFGENRNRSMAR